MESIIETFHIDWKIIIAQAVNFGVVFVVLYIFALKPLSKLMAERKDRIEKGLSDAKTSATLLEQSREQHEKALQQARKEAHEISQESKKEAEEHRVKMLEDAKIEVANIIENGKKSLQAEKEKMVGEAKREIISLSMLATKKLIGQSIDSAFAEKAVGELDSLKK